MEGVGRENLTIPGVVLGVVPETVWFGLGDAGGVEPDVKRRRYLECGSGGYAPALSI